MTFFGRDDMDVVRRQLIEIITDDLRDKQGYMMGVSEAGVISLLIFPKHLFVRAFTGGVFDFKVRVVDRDTGISPEILLVKSLTHVVGDPIIQSVDAGNSTIPAILQDPWYRSPGENLWVFLKLLQVPGKDLGSLTAALLRTTARSLMWRSAARAFCYAEFNDETMQSLALIANSKGHAPPYWLAKQAHAALSSIGAKRVQAITPEAQAGLVVVENAVRQELAGVRPPGQPAPRWPGGGGGQASAASGGYTGPGAQQDMGNSPARQQGGITDNRIADGDLYDLVKAYREPTDGSVRDGGNPPAPPHNYSEPPDDSFAPDPEELAALERLEGGAPDTQIKPKKQRRKSRPEMFNLRPGAGPRRRVSGP
jgi:hypothetical protein